MLMSNKKYKGGVYKTEYGFAIMEKMGEYKLENGEEAPYDAACDLDMGQEIPVEMVDFTEYIREEI